MNKKNILTIIGLSLIGLAHAGGSNIDAKTTATMQATCSITTDSIGFGAVATPLMMQSAQSDMAVKCSNASAYTVELAYGGIYGSGTGGSEGGKMFSYESSNQDYSFYYVKNSSGVTQGLMACGFAGTSIGKVYFPNLTVANLFGSSIAGWQASKGVCTSNNTISGTYPTGWTGAYNTPGNQFVGGAGYTYGVMNGLSKGDKLAYSIQLPGDSSKVWNKGSNSYKNTGNGDTQTIPMIAKIVPDKSGSKYPAPDMYLDTVTAVINY